MSQYVINQKNAGSRKDIASSRANIRNSKSIDATVKGKLLLPRNRKKIKVNRKITENRKIYKPNKLWEFDIKYGYVHGENGHFYLLVFVDVFDRQVVESYTGLSCKAVDLKTTFGRALESLSEKQIEQLVIRSDNGPNLTSKVLSKYINSISGVHEFIPPGDYNKNAHVESFNSIIEIEFFQTRYFESYQRGLALVPSNLKKTKKSRTKVSL